MQPKLNLANKGNKYQPIRGRVGFWGENRRSFVANSIMATEELVATFTALAVELPFEKCTAIWIKSLINFHSQSSEV